MNRLFRSSLLVALAGALALAACTGSTTKSYPSSKPKAASSFPHSTHREAGLECEECHAGISKAPDLKQRHMPTAKKCAECHDDDKRPPKSETPKPHLVFSHKNHVPRVKGKCETCHEKLPEPKQVAEAPRMAVCQQCHNHDRDVAEANCRVCHLDLKRYPRPVEFFSHQGNFVREHQHLARQQVETCATCHDQTYCADCHATATVPLKPEIRWPEKVENDFIHRGDYVSRHQVEAAANSPVNCRKCHGSNFCDSCHTEQRVSDRVSGPRDPHPAGWASGDQHGPAARRNITNCAGCHDQGSQAICIGCHRTINPHPPGFLRKHDEDDQRENAMCRACHP